MTASSIPRVSVVIPTYNHAHLIGEALESLRQQTMPDWEAIVVNNYSDDDTEQVVAGINDDRIRLVNFRNHGVIAASRNRGVALAKSPIIAFLDSDDVWYPRKLAQCLDKLDNRYDLVCHAEKWVRGDGSTRNVSYGPESHATYDSLLFDGNCISTSAVVMKIESFRLTNGFSEDLAIITAEDYDFWLQLAWKGCRIGFLDEILGEYRLHESNQSKGAERHHQAVLAVLRKHFQRRGTATILDSLRARRRLAHAAYDSGRQLQENEQFKDAAQWLRQAVAGWPFSIKAWAALALNVLQYRI